MASLLCHYFTLRKVFVLSLLFSVFTSILVSAYSETQSLSNDFLGTRKLLEVRKEDQQPIKKKTSSSIPTQNQTKLIKPTTNSTKNQTKFVKSPTISVNNQTKLIKLPSDSTKNKTKIIKPTPDSTIEETGPIIMIKNQLKKLNSTSKSSNSTKPTTILSNKSLDLNKPSTPKNKTTTTQLNKKPNELKSKSPNKYLSTETKPKPQKIQKQTKPSWIVEEDEDDLVSGFRDLPTRFQETLLPDLERISTTSKETKPKPQKIQKQTKPSWIDEEDEDDLVSGFRDLPTRFQETLLPDLERISTSSKDYLSKANKEITKGFKPIVGNKYAPTIASIVSFAFILIPLILVSLIFNRIKAYFSLQKLLIFIQVYLSIYFTILCLSSLVTGLEPLRFFYSTSLSTYVCVQVFQTLGYVLYLLLLLMYLVLVFSTDTGLGLKLLGLGQTFVGFAVGLHYYVTVFHRVVLHQPPKTNWKVHGIYATCFLVICLLARAERRKKAYLEDGGEEGKKS